VREEGARYVIEDEDEDEDEDDDEIDSDSEREHGGSDESGGIESR
jgi:hypothetical protein